MKKKKARRKKRTGKKTHVMPAASISEQEKAGVETIPQKEDLQPVPAKKEVFKAADTGGFAPKRYFNVVRQFLAEAKVELKKVTWPSRKELLSTTGVVIILVILISFFLGIVDLGLVKIIRSVLG
jgi:preprotein translocase subunit SecE